MGRLRGWKRVRDSSGSFLYVGVLGGRVHAIRDPNTSWRLQMWKGLKGSSDARSRRIDREFVVSSKEEAKIRALRFMRLNHSG